MLVPSSFSVGPIAVPCKGRDNQHVSGVYFNGSVRVKIACAPSVRDIDKLVIIQHTSFIRTEKIIVRMSALRGIAFVPGRNFRTSYIVHSNSPQRVLFTTDKIFKPLFVSHGRPFCMVVISCYVTFFNEFAGKNKELLYYIQILRDENVFNGIHL